MGSKMRLKKINQIKSIILFIIFWLPITGCGSLFKKPVKSTIDSKKDYSLFDAADFEREIKRLEDITKNHENPAVRTEAHLYLALILLHHNNPSPDYIRSLKELELFLTEKPPEQKIDSEILDWVKVLKQLEKSNQQIAKTKVELNKMSQLNEAQSKRVYLMQKEVKNLKKQIEKLNSKIKELDSLYFRIEKKKKKDNDNF
jgi:hypothetical protein